MSDIEDLFRYRMEQAESTVRDAELMLEASVGPRSIVNRCYYSMFYATLALFLKSGVIAGTSKHSGVIGRFDKEFVLSGKVDRKYSKMLHRLFDSRQEFDYKEFTEIQREDAQLALEQAQEYIKEINRYLHKVDIESGEDK